MTDTVSPSAAAPVVPGVATARINPEYGVRLFLLGLMFAGFALWSVYDGTVRYPAHNRRVAAYQEFQHGGRFADWPAHARRQGWPVARPGPAHTLWDIRTQFIMAALFGPVALLAWSLLGRQWRRRFRADAAGLHGFAGESIPFAAITALDLRDWDRKGIVRLTCTLAGQPRRVVLDDWKFRGMEAIFARIREQRPELVPETRGVVPPAAGDSPGPASRPDP